MQGHPNNPDVDPSCILHCGLCQCSGTPRVRIHPAKVSNSFRSPVLIWGQGLEYVRGPVHMQVWPAAWVLFQPEPAMKPWTAIDHLGQLLTMTQDLLRSSALQPSFPNPTKAAIFCQPGLVGNHCSPKWNHGRRLIIELRRTSLSHPMGLNAYTIPSIARLSPKPRKALNPKP